MTKKYDLSYFQSTGRTEPIRLLFKVAEVEHKGNGTTEEWKDQKENILAKRFPVNELSTLQHNGTTIMQSIEIFRYVARELGLCGSSEEDNSKINEVIDSLNQIFNEIGEIAFSTELDDEGKKEAYTEYFQQTSSKLFFDALVDQLNMNGSNFYLGEKVSAADVFYFSTIKFITASFPTALDEYPELKTYTEKVASLG